MWDPRFFPKIKPILTDHKFNPTFGYSSDTDSQEELVKYTSLVLSRSSTPQCWARKTIISKFSGPSTPEHKWAKAIKLEEHGTIQLPVKLKPICKERWSIISRWLLFPRTATTSPQAVKNTTQIMIADTTELINKNRHPSKPMWYMNSKEFRKTSQRNNYWIRSNLFLS